jgi:acetyl esterase
MPPLDPEAKAYLDRFAGLASGAFEELPVEEARAQLNRASAARDSGMPVHAVEDLRVPGPGGEIALRAYRPAPRGPHPVVVAIHGGCWYLGSLDSYDAYCRMLTATLGCLTLSVDYRLAPEHRFPAAAEDCYAAVLWAARNAGSLDGDAARLAVLGSSAGGNLAAAVALMARDRDGPSLACQALIVPMIEPDFATRSYRENSGHYGVTLASLRIGWEHYLGSARDAENPYAVPIRAPSLAGLAPAIVFTAELDPLRDEGDAYAARLAAEGVPTVHRCYPGMVHGYRGRRADEDLNAALRAAFAR